MRPLHLALPFALLGCSAGAPPPVEPPTVALTPAAVETAPAPTAAAEVVPTATASVEAPRPPAIPDACRGTDLDLDVAIAGGKECDVRQEAAAPPPPEAMEVKLTPARSRIKPGETVDVTVAIVNKTAELLELDLNLSCGKEHQFELEALNAKGERADRINTTCGFGRGCGRRTLHLALDPRGRVHTKLVFKASAEKTDAQCAWKPTGPLQPGRYTLRASTPLQDRDKHNAGEVHSRTAEAPITVGR